VRIPTKDFPVTSEPKTLPTVTKEKGNRIYPYKRRIKNEECLLYTGNEIFNIINDIFNISERYFG
jgi:hypothetical protein